MMQDNGFIEGECSYAYRTVMFSGTTEFVTDMDEKRRALDLMIDKLDANPPRMKKRSLTDDKLRKVAICKVRIGDMSGKESVAE